MAKAQKTILIAEDDKYLGSAYRLKLEKEGYHVLLVTDGLEALSVLTKTKPDIIILDVVMPNMDGFTVLQKIKNTPELKQIPVMIASNLSQSEDQENAKTYGADDYIIKSDIKLKDLLVRMDNLIKRKSAKL